MRLEEFFEKKEVAALLGKDFVLQSIDSGKHQNTKGLLAKIRPKAGGGIPWMVIQDADGRTVVTSDGPKGNIGCPWQPDEIAYFREMLAKARKNLTDADLDAIVQANQAFRAEVEKRKVEK